MTGNERPGPGGRTAGPDAPSGTGRRLLWFVGLWAAGVAATGAVALAIRWALR